jgi:hypothetical protein
MPATSELRSNHIQPNRSQPIVSSHDRPLHKPNSFIVWKNENKELIEAEVTSQDRPESDRHLVAADLWYCHTRGMAVTKRGMTELEEYRRMLMLHGLRGQELTEAVKRKYKGYNPRQMVAKAWVTRTCLLLFGFHSYRVLER